MPRFPIFLKICLPFFFLVALSAFPRAYAVVDAQREVRVAQTLGQHHAAASGLRQVLAVEPWRTAIWEQIGREELAAERYPEAINGFLQAVWAGSLSPDGRFLLGQAYLQKGDDKSAEAVWLALLQSQGPAVRVYEQLFQIQRSRRDFTAVVGTLRAWRAIAPEDAQVIYLLGLYLSAQQPDQALPLLLEAAEKDATYTPAVQTLRSGIAQAANTSDPAYGWLMIGRALGSIGQWDLAVETFQRAVNASPNYAEAWAFLGEANYHRDGSGKTELDRALKLNPQSPVVRALLAVYWRRQGEPKKALPLLEAIAQQEPQEPTWQVEIGNTQAEAGDMESARISFEKAEKLSPNTSLYWQYLAQFSVQYNYDIRGTGLPAARQAVLLAPNDPGALDTMGLIMSYLGDGASAERFLQQALKRDPSFAPALLHLGQLYLIQQQDTGRAHSYLERAASLAGDSAIKAIARRLLQQYYGEGS